ncbi:ROK family protein [Microbacterium sp. EYE_5]|uniref:polyphosphate--glucose phosphotransferase n=1 Tax=unclassified Microbacterium TaxID=2609290 RepID=UPI00200343D2|nr:MULTISPECIES: ROK family protein [unclassified Microbacterium]MCK6080645.1 ROK family protein [Microbacterium sp. EYE_382]MCK6085916.1 ROK family protein [Microbacterium sp. EYE_384]MCK6124586.1 ROK family protein [Microbacterium sp. EYE_80]MCK6127495.1 ROK family protein [Microbacterium sp. EYE_79]MCK6141600.1 ROK family protein [Microbacterium sp. EYE_39]
MTSSATTAVGIDIGGTGIKGALVDLAEGSLLTDRIKVPTPKGAEPDDVLKAVTEVLDRLEVTDADVPLGVAFPAIVKNGRTLSAANVAETWIGFEAEAFFEQGLGRAIHFANDADVAGVAELRYGAAKGRDGLVILTTLGTGIGTAMIYNGVLVPNSELGHLNRAGHKKDFEHFAAYSAMEREELEWDAWAGRLQQYYSHLEFLFTPDLFVVGGGVSKHSEKFLPLLDLQTEIVPAVHRNNAGIIGAAALALAGDGSGVSADEGADLAGTTAR